MARITSASASSGQTPILASVSYNTASLPTYVNLGSGDQSAYTWSQGVGPMDKATFNVGSNIITNTLTWNANGTLQQLDVVDPLNTADAQTCTYSYDDLQRILTDNCGTKWNQTFSYDPFGNVTKTGSSSWLPGYDQTTNRYHLSGGITYDANGRLTNDTFDTVLAWDIEGNLITQSNTNIAYDGLNRAAGSLTGGTWTNYFFAPDGSLMGTVNNWGAISKMFVPLPMSTAVYSGGSLQQYRRQDWQGSVRVASTPSKTLFSGAAYGAFGEPYAPKGTTNNQYAGLTSDISSGTEQVSLSRRYHPAQGRWISPDSIIPDVLTPQSFNSYAYVLNNPLSAIDPSGLECVWDNGSYDSADDPHTGSFGGCTDAGGTWFDPSTFSAPNGDWSNQPNAELASQTTAQGDYTFQTSTASGPDPLAVQSSMIDFVFAGIKSGICSALPEGRTFGVSGSVGGVGGQTGTLEVVVNYNTGQTSGFASGGLQGGWNGVLQGSVFSGFIYGKLGGDNGGYSGGFTTASGAAGLGFFRASSSGGLTGGVQGLVPNGNVTATGASVGVSLIPTPTGGISVTNYSKPLSLGKGLWLSSPIDFLFYVARRGC